MISSLKPIKIEHVIFEINRSINSCIKTLSRVLFSLFSNWLLEMWYESHWLRLHSIMLCIIPYILYRHTDIWIIIYILLNSLANPILLITSNTSREVMRKTMHKKEHKKMEMIIYWSNLSLLLLVVNDPIFLQCRRC